MRRSHHLRKKSKNNVGEGVVSLLNGEKPPPITGNLDATTDYMDPNFANYVLAKWAKEEDFEDIDITPQEKIDLTDHFQDNTELTNPDLLKKKVQLYLIYDRDNTAQAQPLQPPNNDTRISWAKLDAEIKSLAARIPNKRLIYSSIKLRIKKILIKKMKNLDLAIRVAGYIQRNDDRSMLDLNIEDLIIQQIIAEIDLDIIKIQSRYDKYKDTDPNNIPSIVNAVTSDVEILKRRLLDVNVYFKSDELDLTADRPADEFKGREYDILMSYKEQMDYDWDEPWDSGQILLSPILYASREEAWGYVRDALVRSKKKITKNQLYDPEFLPAFAKLCAAYLKKERGNEKKINVNHFDKGTIMQYLQSAQMYMRECLARNGYNVNPSRLEDELDLYPGNFFQFVKNKGKQGLF